ncbi:rRNA maturation RNase YbeY [Patescibacteria group bacterium]|nr:rRNA maturation RNase YbeY [Patescibacteria group bacterium]MCL5797561.1 rRNA maturation RNase YbeY [Patescibacteria group bacterium]
MINVLIKTESHYTVNRDRVREVIAKVLSAKGVKARVEVSLSVVGDRMMKSLNKKYRDLDETTDVLSFPLSEEKKDAPFIDMPDGILRLGDIVISYPVAREEASDENKLVDDKIDELVEHGMLHLLGQHHGD